MTSSAGLLSRIDRLDPASAARVLHDLDPSTVAHLLVQLPVGRASSILAAIPDPRRAAIIAAAPLGTDWDDAQRYPEGSVGRLLEEPPAVFPTGTRVQEAIDALRPVIERRMVTYLFVVDAQERLLGVVAFRELLYATRDATLDSVMIRDPFRLDPAQPLVKAMREVVTRHFPVYPVCEPDGRLVGQVRGQVLFEQQAFEISAQAGSMVGVEKEERLATPLWRAFRFRNPWLLVNLLTVFVAGAVVGAFEAAIEQVVVLAMFLPVMAGQCGNLGAQSLAVTLRGMTLGELRGTSALRLTAKEALLGLLNGAVTGLLAAVAMYLLSARGGSDDAFALAMVTFGSMTVGCMLSGMAGALVPLAMRRLGADPATASAIFLSTATDILSMGLFLLLATWVVL